MTLLWRVGCLLLVPVVALGGLFLLQGFTQKPPQTQGWVEVSPGIERQTFISTIPPAEMTVYQIDANQADFSLSYSNDPRYLSEWLVALPEAKLVFNAAYFHEDFQPSGWFRVEGERIGERAFDLDKSAVWSLSPTLSLLTPRTQKELDLITTGLQSFPLLIERGKPAIKSDSGLLARRTWIGQGTKDLWYVGVVDRGQISLFTLGEWLATLPFPLTTALNLDGGPSSGIVTPHDSTSHNSLSPVSSVGWITVKPPIALP